MSESEAEGPFNPKTGYEHTDVSPAALAGLMAGVGVVTIVIGLILSGIFPGTMNERSEAPTGPPPPHPRLEVDEAAAMRQFDTRVAKRLDSYGWIDRQRGIVHIPIQEAMQRAAAAGLPKWPGNPKAAAKQAAQNGAANPPGKPKAAAQQVQQNGSANRPGKPK